MAKSYILGGYAFPTKTALRIFIQELLKLPPLTNLGHKPFFEDLVRMHWNSQYILGCGADFFYSEDFDTGMYGMSRCLRVQRVDGSRQKFSYRECLDKTSLEGYVTMCLRREVNDQIRAFSMFIFKNSSIVMCPITGEPTTIDSHHVDHEAPQFSELVQGWMQRDGLTFEKIPMVYHHSQEGMSNVTLADNNQRMSWLAYHAFFAKLRVTSPLGNTSRSKARLLTP